MSVSYNPEYDPTGMEGGVDTNAVPWLELDQAPGLRFKPLRASTETGQFSAIVQFPAGIEVPPMVYLGSMDMMILSGQMTYTEGDLAGTVTPGTWGYIPANSRVEGLVIDETTEASITFYGPVAFLGSDGRTVNSILTSLDIQLACRDRGVTLVPNTLAECAQPRAVAYDGPAEPLAIADLDADMLVGKVEDVAGDGSAITHPHFVDTKALAWLTFDAVPDYGIKLLRISEETGVVSLIALHNGVAGPHYHLGAADFLILSGRIGYRSGPPEGYGAGVWFYEPAGARHDATQRVSEEDLVYTANVYGPTQFDDGPGTPITMVQSWIQFKAIADGAGSPLLSNVFANDSSLLAWAPLGAEAALASS